jgi:hypothetical protein
MTWDGSRVKVLAWQAADRSRRARSSCGGQEGEDVAGQASEVVVGVVEQAGQDGGELVIYLVGPQEPGDRGGDAAPERQLPSGEPFGKGKGHRVLAGRRGSDHGGVVHRLGGRGLEVRWGVLHSSLGYQSPADYQNNHHEKIKRVA